MQALVIFKLTDGAVGAAVRRTPGSPWSSWRRSKDALPYKVSVKLCVAEFCLVLPYLMSGEVVARTPIADWPAFAQACAELGVPELSMLVTDDAELVFLSALTPMHLCRRESETVVRQLYQRGERPLAPLTAGCDDPPAEAAGCDDPPAEAAGCDDPPAEAAEVGRLGQRLTELAKYSVTLRELDTDRLASELASLKIGDLVCALPPKIALMGDAELAREYPYTVHKSTAQSPEYVSTACAVETLQKQLPGFPWRMGTSAQFVLAGGATMKHLRPKKIASNAFATSDYDFFLVGADAAAARAAVAEFHAWVAARTGGRFMAWRTEHAISFVTATTVFQIVLRLNPTIERILLNFDIDMCCVAFDGEKIWTTPRGLASLRSGVHLGDPARQSTTFDRRAVKYGRRGYAFAFPGLTAAAYDQLARDSRLAPRMVSKKLCDDPARSMIERVLRGGRTADAAAAADGDYAPHYATLGEEAQYPFASYIRRHMRPICKNELPHVRVATTALAPLLDTPQGAPLAELSAAVSRGDPGFVYTPPLAPPNSVAFLTELGHGQLSGSIHPVTMNSWFPSWQRD